MTIETRTRKQGDQVNWFHPCYYDETHREYARMHLPVAPKCNVQCKFCNRDYDCVNETRPGVTSRILSPEQGAILVDRVSEKIQQLAVVGIAGPGDSLANEETFETLRLVRERHPELALCLATNGLLLSSNVDRLASLGVEFVTVTVNALDPSIGAEVYSWVSYEGQRLTGKRAFELLSSKQWEGIRECVKRGMVVKVNTVFIPGVNDSELREIAERSKEAGVDVMNIIPFIPVRGSDFEGIRSPTRAEVGAARVDCGEGVRQIIHCARCRADAVGFLRCDVSSEFYEDL